MYYNLLAYCLSSSSISTATKTNDNFGQLVWLLCKHSLTLTPQ